MNSDKLSKVVETTETQCLEDILLALGFRIERRWATTCYIKDNICISLVTASNPLSETSHAAEREPHAFLEMISHMFDTTLLVIKGKENTGGGWCVDPITHERISRNFKDLQEEGVTYDAVMQPNPNQLWKYYAKA